VFGVFATCDGKGNIPVPRKLVPRGDIQEPCSLYLRNIWRLEIGDVAYMGRVFKTPPLASFFAEVMRTFRHHWFVK